MHSSIPREACVDQADIVTFGEDRGVDTFVEERHDVEGVTVIFISCYYRCLLWYPLHCVGVDRIKTWLDRPAKQSHCKVVTCGSHVKARFD